MLAEGHEAADPVLQRKIKRGRDQTDVQTRTSKARCLALAVGWYEWREVERVNPTNGKDKAAVEGVASIELFELQPA